MTTLFGPCGATLAVPNPGGTSPLTGSNRLLRKLRSGPPKYDPVTCVPIRSAAAGTASAIHNAVADNSRNDTFIIATLQDYTLPTHALATLALATLALTRF